MRRASTCLALLGLAVLGLPAVASAAPTVTLVAKAVPIPGFPHTGNILGAGAAVEAKFSIKGTEAFGGVPSPLTGVNFYLPAGTKLHPQGFTICQPATLENIGPKACPKKSQASPVGSANVAQQIGPVGGPKSELVKEVATVQAFFAPGGNLQFYTNAEAPISAQLIAATGHYIGAAAPYGQELISQVKLINALGPEAEDVSTESINIKVGAAYKQGKKTIYYGTVPKKCPKKGFPIKAELTFKTGEKSTASYLAPCPKK